MSRIMTNAHFGRSTKATGLFYQVFFFWDLHPEGTRAKELSYKKRGIKTWKCIVVYRELVPRRDR